MKVKALDIAKELGISRATVSLALNNKPGVKEETRKQVLACKKRLETGEDPHSDTAVKGVIKVISVNNHLRGAAVGDEFDLWTIADALICRIAMQWGYVAEVLYYDPAEDSPAMLVASCKRSHIKGVIVSGSEMQFHDTSLLDCLRKIKKPTVIYDCDLGDEFSSVAFHNRGGAQMALDYLAAHGKKHILYLSRNISFFNYTERREGFLEALRRSGGNLTGSIVPMGNTINEISSNLKKYLAGAPLPDAFLTESYHVSIGAIKALQDLDLDLPGKISLIGIDEVPQYMTGGKKLTFIRIPHSEKIQWVMNTLKYEMFNSLETKIKMQVNCKLVEGDTVL